MRLNSPPSRHIRSLLLGTALALLLPGVSHAADVLRVGDQKGGAKALMEAAGVLNGVPYRIDWSLFAGAPMLLEALNAKAIDLGQVGDAPFAFALATHIPVKAVAAVQSDGAVTALVVASTSPIHNVADLAGKRIGTLRGQTGHYLVLAALHQAGLPFDAVKFVYLDPADAKAAMSAGAIDGWATWGPYISLAKLHDGAREIVNGRSLMSGQSYVLATPEAITSKHVEMADFLHRLRLARDWGLTHPAKQAEIWGEQTGFPSNIAQDVIDTAHTRPVPIDDSVVAAQQHVADFMLETGMISEKQNVAAAFDRSFNNAAFSNEGDGSRALKAAPGPEAATAAH
jgi:sulfonate transport system substrate-binding protein